MIQERATMIAETVWTKEMEFEGRSESGQSVVFDAGDRHANGPSPMEAVLMALCSCTAVDVVSILKKKREPLTSLTVSATAEQSAAPPRVFTRIMLTYLIGGAVSKKAAEDAVELSKNKYCSVSKMLEKAALIDFRIEYANDSNVGASSK
jgi:putative redox protein